jgi:tetratricopeptide (TPR) repeat protein
MPKKKIAPVEPDLKEINLDDLLRMAHEAVDKGKYHEAIRMLEVVTEMVPEHTEAWNNLGVANLLANDLERAEIAFRSGLEQDAENPQMIKNLIQTLLQLEDKVEEGMNMLVKYLELRPTDPDAIFMLGRCFEAGGEKQKAITLYKRTLQLDPHFALAREVLMELDPLNQN